MATRTRATTIEDVARAANVSVMAVSYALRGTGRLSEARRRQILQIARDLGYEVNPHARNLRQGRSLNTVALFSLYLGPDVTTRKITRIQALLHEQGFDAPLHAYGTFNEFHPVEQAALMADLRRSRPRAIVCNTAGLSEEAVAELRSYQAEGGIVVSYDDPINADCDQTHFDRERNTYTAARHLVELGHRRLGLYTPTPKKPFGRRLEGFSRALEEVGHAVRDEWLFYGGGPEEGGARMAARILALPAQERPTGMCIINDHAAVTFILELERAGLQVPRDMSVVGHDDVPLAHFFSTPLTTMRHPAEEIASNVVELLRDRLNGTCEGPPRTVILYGELRVRQSTAPPASL